MIARATRLYVVIAITMVAGCRHPKSPPTAENKVVRAHAPPGPTWRARCAELMEQTRVELVPAIPALAHGVVRITRDPETVIRLEASSGGYYEVTISELTPNRDFDTDVREEPWEEVGPRMRPMPIPVLAMHRLHEDRSASISADRVPLALARKLSDRMMPVAEECLALAEHTVSHDWYFAGTVTSVGAWSGGDDAGANGAYVIDAEPRELVTMHVYSTDRGSPIPANSTQRFLVADGSKFREPAAAKRIGYWFRTDTEDGQTSFALARAISMIDDDDKCPDVPLDAGARGDAALDDDGCP